jgi:hypothetical protein
MLVLKKKSKQLHAEDFKDFRWPPCPARESLLWRAKVFKVFGMEPARFKKNLALFPLSSRSEGT